ncbi:hypothetical protein [Bifidobacterium samirii]|uniref:hypothetical protein n=1 Tax=Bifidobacterium samirii TaxID=2306974 RepID=UPI0013DE953B|nr:hypothetical protein [Bifidobacterium samirii]
MGTTVFVVEAPPEHDVAAAARDGIVPMPLYGDPPRAASADTPARRRRDGAHG